MFGWHLLVGSIGWVTRSRSGAGRFSRLTGSRTVEFGCRGVQPLAAKSLGGQLGPKAEGRSRVGGSGVSGCSPVLEHAPGWVPGRLSTHTKSGRSSPPWSSRQEIRPTADSVPWCTVLAHPAVLQGALPCPLCPQQPHSVGWVRWLQSSEGVGESGPSHRLFPYLHLCAALPAPAHPPGHPGPAPGQERVTNRKNNG